MLPVVDAAGHGPVGAVVLCAAIEPFRELLINFTGIELCYRHILQMVPTACRPAIKGGIYATVISQHNVFIIKRMDDNIVLVNMDRATCIVPRLPSVVGFIQVEPNTKYNIGIGGIDGKPSKPPPV